MGELYPHVQKEKPMWLEQSEGQEEQYVMSAQWVMTRSQKVLPDIRKRMDTLLSNNGNSSKGFKNQSSISD